jgi:hypothetical protein
MIHWSKLVKAENLNLSHEEQYDTVIDHLNKKLSGLTIVEVVRAPEDEREFKGFVAYLKLSNGEYIPFTR